MAQADPKYRLDPLLCPQGSPDGVQGGAGCAGVPGPVTQEQPVIVPGPGREVPGNNVNPGTATHQASDLVKRDLLYEKNVYCFIYLLG